MRTPEDALRSVKKYVASVLSPQPTLSRLVSSDAVEWTVYNRVGGAISVEQPTWNFLLSRPRLAPTVVGSPDDPEVYYLSAVLDESSDELAVLVADDSFIDLRIGAGPVVGYALPLQPDWEVRLAYDFAEVPDDRPFCRVGFAGSLNTSGPSLYYEVSQAMTVECQLVKPETADLAVAQAVRLIGVLLQAFRGRGVGLGRPIRIPLYDYEGVALDEEATQRHPSDFMRVNDFSAGPMPDPNDARRIPVICDLRVSWRLDVDLVDLGEKGIRTTDEVRLTENVS